LHFFVEAADLGDQVSPEAASRSLADSVEQPVVVPTVEALD
jgi:hypothetical protein